MKKDTTPSLLDGQTCSRCGEWKVFLDYYPRNRRSRPYQPCCKECSARRSRQYHSDVSSGLRVRTPRCGPEQARENVRKKHAEYYLAHKEYFQQKTAEYRRRMADGYIRSLCVRRTREEDAGPIYTSREWYELCRKYDWRCLYCKERPKKLTADHVLPIKLGGKSSIDNIQPLCRSCNSRKNAKHIDYRY